MGCGVYWGQLREIERALGVMRKYGIPEISQPFQVLYQKRGELLAKVGVKFPRSPLRILKLFGFSPGSIALWHDPEFGWFSEARHHPGALPVYKCVGDDIAGRILNQDIDAALEEKLLAPDHYIGD